MTAGRNGVLGIVVAALVVATPTAAAGRHAASGTTIVVTSTADVAAPVDGTCTLRAAITAANTDGAVGGCPAGNGADTIVLGAHVYSLALQNNSGEDQNATGDLDITAPVTITGQGATMTYVHSDSALDRVFDVHDTTATIERLNVLHGSGLATQFENGAGIRNAGTLTIRDATLFNNGNVGNGHIQYGAGVASTGTLTLDHVDVSDNYSHRGAGVYSTGALTITGSTFTNNKADGGGAIYASGPTSISDTTVSTNFGSQTSPPYAPGGGIYVAAPGTLTLQGSTVDGNLGSDGDGVYLEAQPSASVPGATLTATNDTIIGNGSISTGGSGGGIYVGAGAFASLNGVTLAENISDSHGAGGNLYNDGRVTAKNTLAILADGNCEGSMAVMSLGHNLEYNPSGTTHCFSDPTDLNADPALQPLASNGGPTKTRALGTGSAALDAGAGCASTDQRGVIRPQGNGCDIGAYELLQPFALTLAKAGTGTGTVTSSPAGIACGATCAHTFAGETVTLTPSPASGSFFAGWSGNCTGLGPCVLTMTSAHAVTATFTAFAAPPPPPPPPPAQKCVVPRVVSQKLATAKRRIVAAHCAVGKIKRAYSKKFARGRVVSEKPRAGTKVAKGSRVALVVSRGRRR